jgi:hypothetical protein
MNELAPIGAPARGLELPSAARLLSGFIMSMPLPLGDEKILQAEMAGHYQDAR